MKLENTVVQTAGVFRCCSTGLFVSLGADLNKETNLGDKAKCQYCHETFTLVSNTVKNKAPVWMPDWQLNGKA